MCKVGTNLQCPRERQGWMRQNTCKVRNAKRKTKQKKVCAHKPCQALAPAQTHIQIIRQNYTKILKAFARPETQWATHTHKDHRPSLSDARTHIRSGESSNRQRSIDGTWGGLWLLRSAERWMEWEREERERGREGERGKREGGGNVRRAESH